MTNIHVGGLRWFARACGLAPALLFTLALGCSSSDATPAAHQPLETDSGPPPGPVPVIPAAPAECPVLQTGTVTVMGKQVEMHVGERQADKKGPVLFYWHGTGSVSGELSTFLNSTANPIVDEITAEGGIAVSFIDTVGANANSENTGNNVWFTGDYDIADAILACAVQQLNIDTRRIYAAGCSAGGLEAGTMAMMRSSYLAAVIPNSGGHILPPGIPFQDPSHIPAVMTVHGTFDNDFVILHFIDWSAKLDQDVVAAGGRAVDCTHPNGHCMILTASGPNPATPIDPQIVVAAQWQFLKDHPFGIDVDPYADGLPSVFPSFCSTSTFPAPQ